jgi:hypothetical protein
MKMAMAMATRVAGNKEGNGNRSKSNGNGNKVGGQATASRAMATATAMRERWQRQQGWKVTNRARARVARAIETMMRVAGDKEGKGSKAMVMATRVAGEQTAMATKKAMVTKPRLGGAGGGNDQPLCATQQ